MNDLTKIPKKCHMHVAQTAPGDDLSVESYLIQFLSVSEKVVVFYVSAA